MSKLPSLVPNLIRIRMSWQFVTMTTTRLQNDAHSRSSVARFNLFCKESSVSVPRPALHCIRMRDNCIALNQNKRQQSTAAYLHKVALYNWCNCISAYLLKWHYTIDTLGWICFHQTHLVIFAWESPWRAAGQRCSYSWCPSPWCSSPPGCRCPGCRSGLGETKSNDRWSKFNHLSWRRKWPKEKQRNSSYLRRYTDSVLFCYKSNI